MQSAATPAHFRDYAEAASRLCSATAGFEPDIGLRIGRTSARAGARRSIFPMTGLSGAPAADTDTNLFSLHSRSINRRSHGRSTCCGSEKKFRKVQIKYARCTRFGCTYRGPIGVSTSRTPSVSFSIHMTWFTWKRRPKPPFLKAGNYCTKSERWEANLFILMNKNFYSLDQLEKKASDRAWH